jgi:hypothetical protein
VARRAPATSAPLLAPSDLFAELPFSRDPSIDDGLSLERRCLPFGGVIGQADDALLLRVHRALALFPSLI